MKQRELPRVVVIGGGTGMPVILRGIKHLDIDLTTLVTVADDGGSTGKLRTELDIPAPGDIRNCLAALSDAEPMLLDLFQHRFEVGNGLSGHSMGNLLLAAMTSITGDFFTGIKEISRILRVKGKIYPISNESMSLHAEMTDGTFVKGESQIPKANKKIKRVFLKPEPIMSLPSAVNAIKQADLIVISPGSLFTSILPNLILPDIEKALKQAKAKIVYICNVMTQAGETTGFSAADHVQAIYNHIGNDTIDSIIVHNEPIDCYVRKIYLEEQAQPVTYDIERLIDMGLEVIEGDIIDYTDGVLRHNEEKMAKLIESLVVKQRHSHYDPEASYFRRCRG